MSKPTKSETKMKCLKVCNNRTEAEMIIEKLRKVKIIAMIKSVDKTDGSGNQLQLMVDDHELEKATKHMNT